MFVIANRFKVNPGHEAAFEEQFHTVMEVPKELVPAIRELIARHQA
jgi:heme-degrading monooxygenase HmoA